MATGRRIGLSPLLALLAPALMLVSLAPAHAKSCNPQDLWQALQSVGSSIASPACDATYADPVGDAALIPLAVALGGVTAEDPGANVCGVINNAYNDLINGQSDLGTLNSALSGLGIATSALDTVQSVLSGAANPVAAAECACQWDQGVGALGNDIVACIQGALCDLQALIGPPCSCSPPPPQLANCFPPVDTCVDYNGNPNDPGCQSAIYGNTNPGYVPVVVTPEANGTLVTYGGDSNCAGDLYCFCPSPMVVNAIPDTAANGGNNNNGEVIYACQCPQTPVPTKAAGTSGGLAQVCLCPDGQPAVAPVKTTINPEASDCLSPLTGNPCTKAGQVRMNGQCVTPCSDPTKGMTIDGACCDPSQMSACGTCCPPHTTPEPDGSCFKPGQAQ